MKKYFVYVGIILVTVFSFSMRVDAQSIEYGDYKNAGKFYQKSCGSISEEDKWLTPYVEGGDYITSCLYALDVKATLSNNDSSHPNGCFVIQMNVKKNADDDYDFYFSYDYPLGFDDGVRNDIVFNYKDITYDQLVGYGGQCPTVLLGHYDAEKKSVSKNPNSNSNQSGGPGYAAIGSDTVTALSGNIYISFNKTAIINKEFYRVGRAGKNFITGEDFFDMDEIMFEEVELTCENLFGDSDELKNLIKTIYNLSKILIPLLLIGMGILDFAKAIFAGSEDNMKKASKKFMQRILVAVAIFLIPVLLKFVLGIAYDIWGVLSPDFCGILD